MSRKLTQEEFIEKARAVHGDTYDYSMSKYDCAQGKIKIICKKHGEFTQVANAHLHGCGCKICGIEKQVAKKRGSRDSFIERATVTHGDRYDYSLVEYKGHKDDVKIICKQHGVFEQRPLHHINGCNCPKCSKVSSDIEYFSDRAAKKHGGKYIYSTSEYKNARSNIEILCPIHGVFSQTPDNHLRGAGCPACASAGSKSENSIFDFVSSLGSEPKKGLRNLIEGRKEVDIYIPENKIAIEYNGLYWHSEVSGGKDKSYHLSKTKILSEKGIRLIHIFEDEMIYKKEIVFARLKSMLVALPKIHARKCEIREIDAKTKNLFLEKTHIQGADRASTSLGAYHGEELVAVMTFCKARVALGRKGVKNESIIELSRFSTVPDFRVVGIAGKLLKFYEREYKPKEIISYADKRWSEGGLYEALGFEKIHDSKPNYWYVMANSSAASGRYMRRLHRFNFARHRLEKFFNEKFPKEMSEWEIMKSKGWDRIWDCGNILFRKIVTPSDN